MRDQYQSIRAHGAEVVCVAPHSVEQTRELAHDLSLPFPVLADADRAVFLAYGVRSRLLSLGQVPAVHVIDRAGLIRYAHVGTQQWDIPPNDDLLRVLGELDEQRPPDPG